MTEIIYLARHATPDWTRTELPYHLPPGPPLTPQGEAEANSLGAFLQEAGVTKVFSSPLQRCLETAQIVAEKTRSHIEVFQSLIEWQPGEDQEAVVSRVWPIMELALLSKNEGGPAALVTHGGPIAVLLEECGMQAKTLAGHRIYDNNNPLPPAGVWQVSRKNRDEPWQLCLVFRPENNHTK